MSEGCAACKARQSRRDANELKVKGMHPTAEVVEGKGGKVWIATAGCEQLSDICDLGNYWDRVADAWESAAREL